MLNFRSIYLVNNGVVEFLSLPVLRERLGSQFHTFNDNIKC